MHILSVNNLFIQCQKTEAKMNCRKIFPTYSFDFQFTSVIEKKKLLPVNVHIGEDQTNIYSVNEIETENLQFCIFFFIYFYCFLSI